MGNPIRCPNGRGARQRGRGRRERFLLVSAIVAASRRHIARRRSSPPGVRRSRHRSGPYSKFGFSTPLTACLCSCAACLLLDAADRGHVRSVGGGRRCPCLRMADETRDGARAAARSPRFSFSEPQGKERMAARPACLRILVGGCSGCGTITSPGLDSRLAGMHRRLDFSGYAALPILAPSGSVVLFAPIANRLNSPYIAARGDEHSLPRPPRGGTSCRVLHLLRRSVRQSWAGGQSYGPRCARCCCRRPRSGTAGRHRVLAAAMVCAALLRSPAGGLLQGQR